MYLRHGDISWDHQDGTDAGAVTALASTTAHLNGKTNGQRRRPSQERPGNLLPSIELHHVKMHRLTEAACVEFILKEIDAGRGGVVVTPNLDHLRRCVRDLHFGALVAEADLVVADGMPLVWASRLKGTPLPERVAGSNMISSLSRGAAARGRSIFLLGGAEGTAKGAAEILLKRNPDLKIVGTFCPQIGFETKPKQMAEIVQMLTDAKPDIVFVALGSPKQEHLIAKLKPSLESAWWLGVGVSFSFLTGHVKRAPMWMQRAGVEWLHRLSQEPRRLFKRYIVSGVPFAARLFTQSAIEGVAIRLGRQKPNGTPQASADEVEVPPNGNGHSTTNGHADVSVDRLANRARRMTTAPLHTEGGSLSRLKALVLLGGAVRSTPLSSSVGRSLLDLPLDANGSVLNHWLNHSTELAKSVGLEKLPVRVMVDRNSPEPISAAVKYYGTFRVERDQSEYRGTGGVLRDLALKYEDNDLILVANAAQILLDPLVSLATTLDQRRGDIGIISHRDGTPSGIMLVSVKTLRLIPETGFIDMKEQAMPLIAQNYAVEVLHRRRPTGLPIRSVNDYINAMRYYHMRRAGKTTLTDPLAEDWQPSFGIVEEGAVVDPSARVHDSVVLRGGVVEAGAVLVRSFVCPSGLVRKDKVLVDEFVKPVTLARAGAVKAA
jgi:N-acetylglucosaminyldiphosphoundecaprenol N-acetyl-beta-D-mannosaminyltransferase